MITHYLQLGASPFGLGFLAKTLVADRSADIFICRIDDYYNEDGRLFIEIVTKTKFYKVRDNDSTDLEDYDIREAFHYNDTDKLRDVIIEPDLLYISTNLHGSQLRDIPEVLNLLQIRDNKGKQTVLIKENPLPFHSNPVKAMDIVLYFYFPVQFKNTWLINTIHDLLSSRTTLENFYPEVVLEKNYRCGLVEKDLQYISDSQVKTHVLKSFSKENFIKSDSEITYFNDRNKYERLVIKLVAYYSNTYRYPFINKFLLTNKGKVTFKQAVDAVECIYSLTGTKYSKEWEEFYMRLTSLIINVEQVLPWLTDGKPSSEQFETLKKEYKRNYLFEMDFNLVSILVTFFKRIGGLYS